MKNINTEIKPLVPHIVNNKSAFPYIGFQIF